MGEERRVNLVLVSVDEEERPEFVQKMSAGFSLPEEKIRDMIGSLPFILSRNCTLDQARQMAETVQEAGGLCRMLEPEDKPASAAVSSPPATPALSFQREVKHPMTDQSEDVAAIPLADAGKTPGAARSASRAATGGESVRCIECGEMQPKGEAICGNCQFPLPEK